MTKTTRAPALVLAVMGALGCVKEELPKVAEPEAAASLIGAYDTSQTPVSFVFDSLDEHPVSSDAARGKPTVIAFIQTGSMWAQAEVNFLIPMAQGDGDDVHYFLVALEPRDSRELVATYARVLGVTFPTALADATTMIGAGSFGMLKVPTLIVLDREGRIAWRVDGKVATSAEIRAHLKGL